MLYEILWTIIDNSDPDNVINYARGRATGPWQRAFVFFFMSCLGPCVSRARQALEQSDCQACQVSEKKGGHDNGQTKKMLAAWPT